MVRQFERYGPVVLTRVVRVAVMTLATLCVAFSQLCFAQTASSQSLEASRDHVIGPGDVLEIAVWGYEDLSAVVTVREDGKISFTSLIEEVTAAGLTVPKLQETLTAKLAYYLKNPRVTVLLREARVTRVSVLGSVRSPGVFAFRGRPTLVDAIASAGGQTPDADITCIKITRRRGAAPGPGEPGQDSSPGANFTVVNLNDVLAGAVDLSVNTLFEGDTVYVPRALSVKVMGMVRSPGTYSLERGARLIDAIARAGDITSEGDPARVSVSSGEITRLVSLSRAMLAPEGQDNLVLQDKDIVYVPQAARTVSVLGEVQRPGVYPVGPDTRVFDAIAAAGGPGVDGDTSCVRVTRSSGRETRVIEVDLDKAGRGRGQEGADADVPDGTFKVEPGDVIYVSKAIQVQVLGEVRSPGTYRLRAKSRFIDAVARAGGPLEFADVQRVSLTRTRAGAGADDGRTLTLDLEAVLQGRAPDQNIVLQDQDVIFVPGLVREASVLGEVARPGVYRIHKETRVLDLVALAGGVTPEGDSTGAVLTSKGESGQSGQARRLIDLDSLSAAGGGEQNYPVRNGDVLYVPKAIEVQVLGQVKSPGTYRLRVGSRFVDAIAKAGGLLESADSGHVSLARASGQGAAGVRVLDLDAILRGSPPDQNVVLQDGDIISISELIQEVSVLGEVSRPGTYRIHKETRVLDVLALAGGIRPEGDATSAVLTSRSPSGEVRRTIDLDSLQAAGGGEQNYPVRNGDVLYVPKATTVMVLGKVNAPGTYTLRAASRLMDAVSRAGGIAEDGDPTAVTLTRQGGTAPVETVNIEAIMAGDSGRNLQLQDGDIISVPELVQEVSVLGEVARPGVYRIRKETRVLDVLALAGGVSREGDATSAVLTSKGPSGETRRVIDLDSLQAAGGGERNYLVKNGDVLYVPKAISVMVLGKVKAPGTYTLHASSRLMDAVSRAGGPAPDGDPTAVTLTRRGGAVSVEAVNIEAIMAGDSEHNVPLRDGDIVFVPELVRDVSVLGEVARPGVYSIRKETTLLEALALAGGITQMGDSSAIRLTRRTANGEPRTLEFDADRPSKAGDVSTWVLRDGDAIYVPRAIAVQVLGEVGNPGRYYLKAGSCVLDAIALAGGLTQDADGSSVTLTMRTRTEGAPGVEGRVYILDVSKVLIGADLAANRRLSDEDTIFVPRADREVLVVGEVQRPGIYKVREDARLMDAIALAGGPTKRAALEAVCVFRKGEIRAGEQVMLGRDNLFFSGKADENPQVLGGDIVYVPATSKIEWESVFSFLSGLKLIKDLLGR